MCIFTCQNCILKGDVSIKRNESNDIPIKRPLRVLDLIFYSIFHPASGIFMRHQLFYISDRFKKRILNDFLG